MNRLFLLCLFSSVLLALSGTLKIYLYLGLRMYFFLENVESKVKELKIEKGQIRNVRDANINENKSLKKNSKRTNVKKQRRKLKNNKSKKRKHNKGNKIKSKKGTSRRGDRKKGRSNNERGSRKKNKLTKKNNIKKTKKQGKNSSKGKKSRRNNKSEKKSRKKKKSGKNGNNKRGNKVRKTKKGRKNNKGKKNKSKKSKSKKMSRKSKSRKQKFSLRDSTCLNFTCIDEAVSYLRLLKDRVANYEKQNARITRQNKTGSGKSGKKGLFGPVVRRIVENGGGNASNLTCNGKKNSGAAQLTNLTETLLKCEDEIKNACDPSNLPQPNMTEIAACNEAITIFKSKTGECIKKTGAEACTCWDDATIASSAATIKKCDCKHPTFSSKLSICFFKCLQNQKTLRRL